MQCCFPWQCIHLALRPHDLLLLVLLLSVGAACPLGLTSVGQRVNRVLRGSQGPGWGQQRPLCTFRSFGHLTDFLAPGSPVSDWFFSLRTHDNRYCGLDLEPSSDQQRPVIVCALKAVPYDTQWALLFAQGAAPPLQTLQPLLVLSRSAGLCSSSSSSPSQPDQEPGQRLELEQEEAQETGAGRPEALLSNPVSCEVSPLPPSSTFSLTRAASGPRLSPELVDLDQDWLLLQEGGLYCRLADTQGSTRALVCDLELSQHAMQFQFQRLGYPLASLTSLATEALCGIKAPSLPAPHDVTCTETSPAAAGRPAVQPAAGAPHPFAAPSASARKALHLQALGPGPGSGPGGGGNDVDRIFFFTMVLQHPAALLKSGVVVGITTFLPGPAGGPMQRCCPRDTSPHVLDCYEPAGDQVPDACWYNLDKVDAAVAGPLIADGDLVSLEARAFSRYCSISVDGTLLCISSRFSNATRNLFVLHLKGAAVGAARAQQQAAATAPSPWRPSH